MHKLLVCTYYIHILSHIVIHRIIGTLSLMVHLRGNERSSQHVCYFNAASTSAKSKGSYDCAL